MARKASNVADESKAIPVEGRRSTYGGIGARLTYSGYGSSNPTQQCGTLTSEEIDARCDLVLSEIEQGKCFRRSRCRAFEGRYVESDVLHGTPQTFVPRELRAELEAELDRLLNEQILREERNRSVGSREEESGDAARSKSSEVVEDDGGACRACGGPCSWVPFCDADLLAKRRKELYRELKSAEKDSSKTVRSVVARSALNGGETMFVRQELVRELKVEILQIDSKLKLTSIDDELHRAYASAEESVSIRSLHGYDTTVKRRDAIWALEHEQNRHVARMVALETIDGVLEWMLEGWYFGERDTKDRGSSAEVASYDQRGTLMEKLSSVQRISDADAMRNSEAKELAKEEMRGAETKLKYGVFWLTFMYFRALHTLRKEKATWDGSEDLVSLRHGPPVSEERKKMMEEERNAVFRRKRIEHAMAKARIGEERKMHRLEKERLEKLKIREWDARKKLASQRLATTVQRVFRGHLGRTVARVRGRERQRAERAVALENACATDIARAWRGYCGRLDAGYLRAEMAKFLYEVREEEARDEEEEYWAMTSGLNRRMRVRQN
ncbi:hypothetical protein ACHAWF_004647 [Thalassiosira exigua]